MKASIVINTYNRADYLANAVRSLATQSYPHVELVVVNGPSTDGTELVLKELQDAGYAFKLLSCASRNLSESRNIGIAACAGDVVFFMDDDAVAHPRWVERIIHTYHDPAVGAAGGFTIDHTGMAFQCRYTVCDRMGNARYLESIDPETFLSRGTGFCYPSLLGTNCSFRRSELLAIGGFDEVFAYMLDETDVCVRVFDRGFRIVTVPNALVLHKYAPSHTRNAERIPSSLLAPARSKSYFMLKHALHEYGDFTSISHAIDDYRRDIEFSNRWFLDHKKISASHYAKLSAELLQGISEGIAKGTDPVVKRLVSPHLQSESPHSKTHVQIRADDKFRTTDNSLRIYMVSQGYPPADTSGIARWTRECAIGLSERGHEVHVLTRSATQGNHVDVVDGVWVHYLSDILDEDRLFPSPVPLPSATLCRAEAVLREVHRCRDIWGVDVVTAPIWDIEGILCAAHLEGIPVVTSLHTTYLLALPFKSHWQQDARYRRFHVERIIAGERWLLDNSSGVLANSNEILREINDAYGLRLDEMTDGLGVVLHGIDSIPKELPDKGSARPPGQPLRILFVGRLEERKGPDTLLGAILRLPRGIGMVRVDLIGKAPDATDAFHAELLQRAASCNARRDVSIRFLGHVDDKELQAAYAECDIFVAPSRFESFGLILLEAMRWRKPVVACNIGGMREVVENGVSGILVGVSDEAALANALESLIVDPERRVQLADAGSTRYASLFTRSHMADSLEQYLHKVCSEELKA